ncbi:hypothetical protein [Kocuria oceani]|uniref:Uncharacterized protein n=1 Tax=Kocuria oceani TaxID=988827 RepID=A0ABV9TJ61_9MICC|nr:hypothetical protein [Kocuria oceani]
MIPNTATNLRAVYYCETPEGQEPRALPGQGRGGLLMLEVHAWDAEGYPLVISLDAGRLVRAERLPDHEAASVGLEYAGMEYLPAAMARELSEEADQ